MVTDQDEIRQGDVWWADFGDPIGSSPVYRRPVVVVQGDRLNTSDLSTVVCVSITSRLKWSEVEDNVFLPSRDTGLPRDSVANVSQIWALDRVQFEERVGQLSRPKLEQVLDGIGTVLGR